MNQIDLQFSLDSHYIYNVGHMVISFEPRWLATWKVKHKNNKTNGLFISQIKDPNNHIMRGLATH